MFRRIAICVVLTLGCSTCPQADFMDTAFKSRDACVGCRQPMVAQVSSVQPVMVSPPPVMVAPQQVMVAPAPVAIAPAPVMGVPVAPSGDPVYIPAPPSVVAPAAPAPPARQPHPFLRPFQRRRAAD